MDGKSRRIRNEIIQELNEICRELSRASEELKKFKGIGAEHCSTKLNTLSGNYREKIRRLNQIK